jgi:ATP-binding cassette subfamily B protein
MSAMRHGSPSSQRAEAASSSARPVESPAPDADDGDFVDATELVIAARGQHKSLRRLPGLVNDSWRLAWQADRKIFLATTILQVTGGLVVFAQLRFMKQVLDKMTAIADHHATTASAMPAVIALVAVTSFSTIAAAVLSQQQRVLSELVTRTTWQRILDVASAVSLRAFESPAFFDRFNRVQTNALSRPYVLTQGLIALVGGGAGAIGVAGAIISIQPVLLPLLLVSGIPLWITGRLQSRREFKFAVAQTPRLRLRSYLLTVLSERNPAKELRAFGFGASLRRRFDQVYGEYVHDLRRHVGRRSLLAFVGSLFSAVVLGATIAVLVWMVGRGDVSLTGALTAIVAIRLMGTQITSIFTSVQQIFESNLFLDDYHDFLRMKPAADEAEAGATAPTGFDELTVDRLSFTYPGSNRPALHDVSINVRHGEVVALVGENGSGKTTLAKLLAALYEPDAGTVAWDGVDVRTYDRAGLRRAIAVIFQDFVRYELTARENVGAGRPEAIDDVDAIAAAAHQAGAGRFLEDLPHGYETVLSKQFKGGRDLSLGQWQRVALARAFYRDAPFVILDEPSSALDPRAEHDLFSRIRELLENRTVLFISHRFSSVRSADRIYVMAEGRVVESGTHDELMSLAGTYAELFTLQAAAYLDPADRP